MASSYEILNNDNPLNPRVLNAWIGKDKKVSAKDIPPNVRKSQKTCRIYKPY